MTAAPWVPSNSLATRLVVLRHEMKLSQREAATQTGVPYGVWQGMESGRSPHRLDEQIAKISRSLNVDRNWLMWGDLANQGGAGD